jgi:hypothetical protein
MAEWRKDVFAIGAADSAEHVTRLAYSGIEAFHESEIAIGCGAQRVSKFVRA